MKCITFGVNELEAEIAEVKERAKLTIGFWRLFGSEHMARSSAMFEIGRLESLYRIFVRLGVCTDKELDRFRNETLEEFLEIINGYGGK